MADMPQAGLVRRNGRLEPIPFGTGQKEVLFSNGRTRAVVPIPWGDLATAQLSTGIPNVDEGWPDAPRQRETGRLGDQRAG